MLYANAARAYIVASYMPKTGALVLLLYINFAGEYNTYYRQIGLGVSNSWLIQNYIVRSLSISGYFTRMKIDCLGVSFS